MRNQPSWIIEETAFERHFTPKQLADLWLFHESTVRRMFIDEPGVLKYGKASRHDGRKGLRDAPNPRIGGAPRL